MYENIRTMVYAPIRKDETYEVFVSRMLFDMGWRIETRRDGHRICEITDLHLECAQHRRWLENYLTRLAQQAKVTDVYFGMGMENHYLFNQFRKNYHGWKSTQWTDDLHHDLLR